MENGYPPCTAVGVLFCQTTRHTLDERWHWKNVKNKRIKKRKGREKTDPVHQWLICPMDLSLFLSKMYHHHHHQSLSHWPDKWKRQQNSPVTQGIQGWTFYCPFRFFSFKSFWFIIKSSTSFCVWSIVSFIFLSPFSSERRVRDTHTFVQWVGIEMDRKSLERKQLTVCYWAESLTN